MLALDLFAVLPATNPDSTVTANPQPPQGATAPERVIASELQGRDHDNDALSMMVSSMVRMVQVGQQRDSRWKAS